LIATSLDDIKYALFTGIEIIAAGAKDTAAGISQTKIGVQKLNEAAENLKAIA